MRSKIVFIIIGLLFVISRSHGVERTEVVFNSCLKHQEASERPESMSSEDWYRAGLCDGFFTGFHDGEYLQYVVDSDRWEESKTSDQISNDFANSRAWCEPKEGLSKGQRISMFTNFVKQHPESLHQDSYLTYVQAMRPFFSCVK